MDSSQANKVLIATMIERVWRQGDRDALPQYWTADCVNHADPALQKQGLAALRAYHAGFADWFRDYYGIDIVLEQQVAEGDRIVTQIVTHATHRAKQRRVSLSTIRIDRIVGGKIAEHWSVADMAGLMAQLG